MPTISTAFRSVCGRFMFVFLGFMAKRGEEKKKMMFKSLSPKSKLDGLLVGLVLSYLYWNILLFRCGDLELNPGPGSSEKSDGGLRQTRLQAASTKEGRSSSVGAASKEPSLADVMAKLSAMDSAMKEGLTDVRNDVQAMTGKIGQLQSEVDELKEQVGALRSENALLQQQQKDLWQRVERVERKNDELENRSKRNNLLFYGIERDQDEKNEQCEEKVKAVFTDRLKLGHDIKLDGAHRVGSQPKSPIIVRCTFYKDKVAILKAKKELRGSNVFIGEDFSKPVRDIRRQLSVIMKEKKANNENVFMVHDHLVIDGKRFFLSADGKGLVGVMKGAMGGGGK